MNESFSRSLKGENEELWEKVLNHPFVEEMGDLELPVKIFKTFIEQDYQYLLGFIRSLGLFLAKSEDKGDITRFRDLVEINFEELKSLEKSYEYLDYSKENLESNNSYLVTESYISFLLRQGYESTKFEVLGAILPCDWIFADIGNKLADRTPNHAKEEKEVYLKWIESYASEEYQDWIRELREEVDEKYKKASTQEIKRFKKNFATGLKFEHAFLESVYNLSGSSV